MDTLKLTLSSESSSIKITEDDSISSVIIKDNKLALSAQNSMIMTTSDYQNLSNRPKINGVLLNGGNNTILPEDIGALPSDYIKIYRGEFPNIGTEGKLYIAIDEGMIYTWDNVLFRYIVIGADYNNIKTINGGNA